MVETLNKVMRVTRRLVQEYGREPTDAEVASGMGISAERVSEILKMSLVTVSLESPTGEAGDSYVGDTIEDRNAPLPEEAAEHHEREEQVGDVLSTLSERESQILKLRFGLTDGRTRTLKEVSWDYGVTRERIRQIETNALRKLRHPDHSEKLRDLVG